MATFQTYQGREISKVVPELADLRITVFREYPYLYDGHPNYEKKYLQTYVNSPRSLIVIARSDDGVAIGATTCLPLLDEEEKLQGNFKDQGFDIADVFYFGESVVLQEYRGRGLGKTFFDFRESHAQSFGTYKYTSFCAAVRPDQHPLKPQAYKSPASLWQRMSYRKLDGVTAHYSWKDLGEREETQKLMQFWIKKLV